MHNIKMSPLYLVMILFSEILFPLTLPAQEGFREDFSKGVDEKGLPMGWKLKQWFGKTRTIEIITEKDNHVLHLNSKKESFGVYKEFDFDSKRTPILNWRWKVTRLPHGGDVRIKKKDDQAAQLYVMFPRFPKMINTRMVGYIWETGTPKGERVTSRKSSKTRYIVLQSGKEHLGKWMTERRNIYEDYKTLFGEEP
ncbi:MAG: DUF3047 domain-containing protein, partial [Nitrospiria bacterium]